MVEVTLWHLSSVGEIIVLYVYVAQAPKSFMPKNILKASCVSLKFITLPGGCTGYLQ